MYSRRYKALDLKAPAVQFFPLNTILMNKKIPVKYIQWLQIENEAPCMYSLIRVDYLKEFFMLRIGMRQTSRYK